MKSKVLLPFIDVLFMYLLVFVSITMLLKIKVDSDSEGYQQKNAVYLITLNWEGNADLDLWGKDSANHVVGFNRREGGDGSLLSLSRDCLGAAKTEIGENGEPVNKVNEEIITIRGTVTGEYVFNVHAYDMHGAGPTKATVSLIKNKPYTVIVKKEKEFTTSGDEETFFRFSVDKDSKVVDINELPTKIAGQKE